MILDTCGGGAFVGFDWELPASLVAGDPPGRSAPSSSDNAAKTLRRHHVSKLNREFPLHLTF